MQKILKIGLFTATKSLAHLLIACHQPNLTSSNQDYENETDLCIVPNQEQSFTKVYLSVQQVQLYERKESVFQNILSCIMDQRYVHVI